MNTINNMKTHYNLKVTNKPPRKAKAKYIQALLVLIYRR